MSQRNRDAVSIDITEKQEVNSAGGVRISETKWNPNKGADAAKQLAVQIALEQHRKELEAFNNDPVIARIIQLEQQVEQLQQQVLSFTEGK